MANFNFKKSAEKETSLSEIMIGREKSTTEEIIENYPDGVKITDFDMVSLDDKIFPIFNIAENEKIYFAGGFILNKIVSSWLDAFGGDLDSCREEFRKSGGIKVRLYTKKTGTGKNITAVDIL